MNFASQGRPMSENGIDRVCQMLGIPEAKVWAVLSVETAGFGYLPDRRPQILFERHIFHRLTKGQFDAGNEDISNATPRGYVGGAGEYPRLEKAIGLDESAALRSASWGLGQVLGDNFGVAGFASVQAMVTALIEDEDAQLMAMANFIQGNNLAGALQRENWRSFASGYNGTGFEENHYDISLAAAHAKYRIQLPDLTLRTVQVALTYLGYRPGRVDGVLGQHTRSALMEYQKKAGLAQTGDLDPDTEARLLAEAFTA